MLPTGDLAATQLSALEQPLLTMKTGRCGFPRSSHQVQSSVCLSTGSPTDSKHLSLTISSLPQILLHTQELYKPLLTVIENLNVVIGLERSERILVRKGSDLLQSAGSQSRTTQLQNI